ncbi:MAG: signal peptidase I [Kiritimatiellae bacterium]|nr:signal peptidase I [Kiritimatiellia bacterium]
MNSGFRRLIAGRSLTTTLWRAAGLAVITWILFTQVLTVCRLDGASMEPTMRDRSVRLVNLLKYRTGSPARGEVVIIRAAGRRVFYLKRILGLPGETVSFENGQLFIDGEAYDETYLKDQGIWTMSPVILKSSEYFVAGDNRSVPITRHLMGTVERGRIAGGLLW